MARTGKIILAKNIKMDKNYKAVLNYTEQQMVNLLTNQSNLVYQATDYQFIRDRGTIKVNCPYSQALQTNYMAFQNPDYSGKWFFAFIDEVKFLGGQGTDAEIIYTVDIWSTWWDYWNPQACFTVREHVIDDSIGANTTPENLEIGEYIYAEPPTDYLNDPANDFYIGLAATDVPDPSLQLQTNHIFNGIYSGLCYFIFKTAEDCTKAISMWALAGKSDYIYSVFMIPKIAVSYPTPSWYQWQYSQLTCDVGYIKDSTSSQFHAVQGVFPTHVGKSYTPVNKKLFVYPFSYLLLDNNSGTCQPYYYEDFIDDPNDTSKKLLNFMTYFAISIGMSMKICPMYYKNDNINYENGIMLGKLPVGSWISDAFTNWLTQNSLNIVSSFTGNITQIATGNIGSGALGIMNSMGQIYQRSLIPYQTQGNAGAGDVNFSETYNGGLSICYMTIRDEYAERIDQYFTRRGYCVNKVKIPNMLHRENYNYVQVAEEENLAYPNNHNNICIPAKPLDQINSLFRSGITIWNNHTNFGNYSVSNGITQ